MAFQYTEGYNESIHTFANNINTVDGGTHLTGFRTALTRTINNYARKNNLLKEKDENFTGDDVRQGLTAIISVKLADPQFEGQTKAKLGNANVKSATESVVGDALQTWLEENPNEARRIVEKCSIAARIREQQAKIKDTIIRKGAFDGLSLPGKLADCTEKDPSRSELFIVEGDSAGGSAKQGRDRRFQAILPLRGKILNVERAGYGQDARQRRNPGAGNGPGRRHRRQLRGCQAALSPHRDYDRRRRGRRAHSDLAADLLLPQHERPGGGRLSSTSRSRRSTWSSTARNGTTPTPKASATTSSSG